MLVTFENSTNFGIQIQPVINFINSVFINLAHFEKDTTEILFL